MKKTRQLICALKSYLFQKYLIDDRWRAYNKLTKGFGWNPPLEAKFDPWSERSTLINHFRYCIETIFNHLTERYQIKKSGLEACGIFKIGYGVKFFLILDA